MDPYYYVYIGNYVYKSPVGRLRENTDEQEYKWEPFYWYETMYDRASIITILTMCHHSVMPKGINNLYFEVLDKVKQLVK